MDTQPEQPSQEEKYFISAVQQEVFNRIFPCIRHDLVGYISASLMRVSIMDRHLSKAELAPERLKEDLKKIELQLKDGINGIRALQFWDFDAVEEDTPLSILTKSVHLMASQLALKFIQVNIHSPVEAATEAVNTKPLLYSLLCLWSYIEDSNFDNNHLDAVLSGQSIQIKFEPKIAQNTIMQKDRNLVFSQALVERFVKHHQMDIRFLPNEITLSW